MLYLTDQALLIGGVRGSGRSTLLLQMLQNDYPQAWYTDFSDARLAGFDSGDFDKLSALVAESGKGILLLDKVDYAQGWARFIGSKLAEGIKVVATVSLDTLLAVQQARQEGTDLQLAGSAAAQEAVVSACCLSRAGSGYSVILSFWRPCTGGEAKRRSKSICYWGPSRNVAGPDARHRCCRCLT